MKILYVVIDGKISGGNHICATLLRAALEAGHDVELLTPSLGPLTDQLARDGIRIHLLRLDRSFHFHQSIVLAYLLKKWSINLVHTHTNLNSEILIRIACFFAGLPIVCHQHDPTDAYHPNPIIARYQRWLDRRTSKLVTQFVAVSKYRQEAMVKGRRYPADKIRLIYNGIDVERFFRPDEREAVRREWKLNSHQIAVGLIGRLEPAKGQDTLIRAVPLILKRHPQTKFFIMGDDHLRGQPSLTQYRKTIQDLGVNESCFLLGFQENIPKLIQGLDIVTLPSWWEGHPLAILEAMATQKPVVASNVGGVPEIIDHGETGILISPQNPQVLADAICKLIENPELRKDFALHGYEKVRVQFDQRQMIDQILSLYDQIKVSSPKILIGDPWIPAKSVRE